MNHVYDILDKVSELIFNPPENNLLSRSFTFFCLIFLFLIGIIHWAYFFNFGEMSFKAYDWPLGFRYYTILRESIITHTIPYHVSVSFPDIKGTNRFLAIPETLLSPQIILLPLMNMGRFVLFNTLLLYSFGFIGCLLIKKRYQLSIFSFSILYSLYNFNGHITSKIAVGCSMWVGYFLLSFFCLFIFELIEEKRLISTPLKLSFLLFAIIIQGAFHIYIWCMIFLLLIAIFNREYLKHVFLIILFSSLLSLFRLFPAAITFWNKEHSFITGFPTISDLFNALITIRQHTYYSIDGIFGDINIGMTWDEYNIYIGIIGLAVITCFGIYLRFSNNPHLANYKYKALDMPILILTIFSLSYFYAFIAKLPIPLLNTERISSRFLIIPLLFLVVISSIRIQQLSYKFNRNAKLKFLAIAGVLQMAFSLANHSFVWRIPNIERYFKDEIIDFSVQIIRQQDILYALSVKITLLISLVTLLALICLFFRTILRKDERL